MNQKLINLMGNTSFLLIARSLWLAYLWKHVFRPLWLAWLCTNREIATITVYGQH